MIRRMASHTGQRAATNPWAWYTDPAIAALEHERIFARSWQYAGHLGQLRQPGSYFASDCGPIPVVVTRDREDVLRAFINACRHRGSLVASGEGCRNSLQCPYHAWTYGLDGQLRAAPRSDQEAGFEKDALGLRPASVDRWGPLVFVNPDPDAAPLADALGSLPAICAEHGLDLDALEFHERVPYVIPGNWKIAVENYLECYHCELNHPGLMSVVDEDRYTLSSEGLHSSQVTPVKAAALEAGSRAPYDVHGEFAVGHFHFLWPNLKVNVSPGRPNLSVGPVIPGPTPETSRGFLDYFYAPGTPPGWIADFLEFDNQVGAEDRLLIEGVQRGVANGLLREGRMLLASEHLMAHFQGLVRAALD
jgi:phenylpropionate dioxygenase-like ring-hydroxylating dioxygenase large terminal subunit